MRIGMGCYMKNFGLFFFQQCFGFFINGNFPCFRKKFPSGLFGIGAGAEFQTGGCRYGACVGTGFFPLLILFQEAAYAAKADNGGFQGYALI